MVFSLFADVYNHYNDLILECFFTQETQYVLAVTFHSHHPHTQNPS